VQTTGTLGTVLLNQDGSFTYDPNGQFEDLGVGETATDSFTYRVSDGNGGTDSATVTVTITGDSLQVSQIVINDGSAQRSMVTSLTVHFNANVTIEEGAFQLINRDTQEVVDLAFAFDPLDGSIVTLTFLTGPSVQTRPSGNSLVDGNYKLVIDSAMVIYNGLQLDGDGPGGDYVFGEEDVDNFFRFYSDLVGRNRAVNLMDYAAFRAAYGSKVGDDNYRDEADYDGNGAVTLLDFARFRTRYGTNLDS
jgi:VCBS repeat-containing protein